MLYEFLTRDRIDEVLHEAEKSRLIYISKAKRDEQTRPILTALLCRVGLISAC